MLLINQIITWYWVVPEKYLRKRFYPNQGRFLHTFCLIFRLFKNNKETTFLISKEWNIANMSSGFSSSFEAICNLYLWKKY